MKNFRLGVATTAIGLGLVTFGLIGQSTAVLAASIVDGQTITVSNLGHATLSDFLAEHGEKCDDTNNGAQNGWHFILTGLEVEQGVLDDGDIPDATITFSDLSTGTAEFTGLAGNSGTGHFLNKTDHQSDSVYPTSVSLTFPNPTDVSAYGNFVLSHIPCDFPETTTTTTTTTMAPTTTTTQPEVTTTVPQETTTVPQETTTAPEATTTTAPPAETTTTASATTVVQVGGPAPTVGGALQEAPTTAAPILTVPEGTTLPATGSTSSPILVLGGLLALFGTAIVIRSRRSTNDAS